MSLRYALPCALLLGATGCHASVSQSDTTPDPTRVLPLKRLLLYETGVGYYERAGRLDAGKDAVLPVPASHLDDALKSLVVLGKDGKVSISGVVFSSVVSQAMARALAGLPPDSSRALSFRDVLAGMKGARVRVVTKEDEVEGRIVEVADAPVPVPSTEKKKRESDDDDDSAETDKEQGFRLLVLEDDGSIRRFTSDQLESVRPLGAAHRSRLDAAVDALSSGKAQIQRDLRVLASSSAPVRLGYIAEASVWRATYRMVLDAKRDQGALQGWALVHNDTDETWRNVRVQLVSGRPQSFLFPLAAPRYERRDLIEPAHEMSTMPQLAERTPDQMWGDHLDAEVGLGSIGTIGHGSGSGSGYGYGVGRRARAPRVRMGSTSVSGGAYTGESEEISLGSLASTQTADGREVGALFSYSLAQPLSLRSRGSALVPFVQQRVAVRRLTWFDAPGQPGRSAARVSNSTRQTLPAGTIALFEGSGFAGESALRRMKPREVDFVHFGVDLDLELEQKDSDSEEKTKAVRYRDRYLHVHFVRTTKVRYELVNRSGSPRTAALVLSVVDNADVKGADELDYDSEARRALALFRLKPENRSQRTLTIAEGLRRSVSVDRLNAEELRLLAKDDEVQQRSRTILEQAATLRDIVEKTDEVIEKARARQSERERDLTRLQRHLEALGGKDGSGEGAGPLVKRILALEDARTAERDSLKKLRERRKKEIDAVHEVLSGLSDREPESVE